MNPRGHDSYFSFLCFITKDDLKSWATDTRNAQANLFPPHQEKTSGQRRASLSYHRTTKKPFTLRERLANINNPCATHFPPSLQLCFFFSLTQTQTAPEGRPSSEARLFQVGSVFCVPEARLQQEMRALISRLLSCSLTTLPVCSHTPSTRNNRSIIAKYIS